MRDQRLEGRDIFNHFLTLFPDYPIGSMLTFDTERGISYRLRESCKFKFAETFKPELLRQKYWRRFLEGAGKPRPLIFQLISLKIK